MNKTKQAMVAALGALLACTPSVLAQNSPTPEASTSTLPQFGHVILVVGENTDYSSSVGGMTYLDSLVAKYGLATNYYADTHPSIGNYFVLTAGQIFTNNDSDTPSSLPLSANNIAFAVQQAGKTWKDYEESTNGCGAVTSGKYIVRHDPLRYFTDINSESANFVCMSQFATDISNHTLPNFSFLAPNGCDDAHDCSLSTFDNFLKTELTPLLASSYFQTGGDGLLIVTFDEDSGSGSTTQTGTTDGGQVETVVISAQSIAGHQSSTRYYHENTLRTLVQALGVSTSNLGAASSAAAMSDFFSATSGGTVTLSPTSLSFGNVTVGTTSSAQTLSLVNGTSSAVSVNITISGTNAADFSQTNNCGSSLAGGNASCTISVSFKPSVAASETATLNTGITGLTASLSGTGVSSSGGGGSGSVTVSPTSLSFGHVKVGTPSAPQTVTVTNNGSSSVAFGGVSATAGYTATATGCGTSLASKASCSVSVTFDPTKMGKDSGTLTISVAGAPTVSLSGWGSH